MERASSAGVAAQFEARTLGRGVLRAATSSRPFRLNGFPVRGCSEGSVQQQCTGYVSPADNVSSNVSTTSSVSTATSVATAPAGVCRTLVEVPAAAAAAAGSSFSSSFAGSVTTSPASSVKGGALEQRRFAPASPLLSASIRPRGQQHVAVPRSPGGVTSVATAAPVGVPRVGGGGAAAAVATLRPTRLVTTPLQARALSTFLTSRPPLRAALNVGKPLQAGAPPSPCATLPPPPPPPSSSLSLSSLVLSSTSPPRCAPVAAGRCQPTQPYPFAAPDECNFSASESAAPSVSGRSVSTVGLVPPSPPPPSLAGGQSTSSTMLRPSIVNYHHRMVFDPNDDHDDDDDAGSGDYGSGCSEGGGSSGGRDVGDVGGGGDGGGDAAANGGDLEVFRHVDDDHDDSHRRHEVVHDSLSLRDASMTNDESSSAQVIVVPRATATAAVAVAVAAAAESGGVPVAEGEQAEHRKEEAHGTDGRRAVGSSRSDSRPATVSVVGTTPTPIRKAEMVRWVYSRAALVSIKEGTELQQHVWGVLLNQRIQRALIIGPARSGKCVAVLSVAASLQRFGRVAVVTYGQRRIASLVNMLGYLPSVSIRPYWRSSDANIVVVTPAWLTCNQNALPKISMVIVDRFDELIDWGLEKPILETLWRLSPEAYLVATARVNSARLRKLAVELELTVQIERFASTKPTVAGGRGRDGPSPATGVLSRTNLWERPSATPLSRHYRQEAINFTGSRRRALCAAICKMDHGTKLVVIFAKNPKEAKQYAEDIENENICEVWCLRSKLEELRHMSREHLADRQRAVYVACTTDHEDLMRVKGSVDVLINVHPVECDQAHLFRTALLKDQGVLMTLTRCSTGSSGSAGQVGGRVRSRHRRLHSDGDVSDGTRNRSKTSNSNNNDSWGVIDDIGNPNDPDNAQPSELMLLKCIAAIRAVVGP